MDGMVWYGMAVGARLWG